MPPSLTRRQALGVLGALALPPNLLPQTPASPPPTTPIPAVPPPPPLADLPPDLPNFHPIMEQIARDHAPRLSFLDPKWKSLNEWKSVARPAFLDRLSYHPGARPVGAELISREPRAGFTLETVRIHGTTAYDIPAYVLIPDSSTPLPSKTAAEGRASPPLVGARGSDRRPAVVAMHCHSGRYVWGHQKVLSHPHDTPTLTEFRNGTYGRPWAEALVRRGYIVIVIDAFYFGERRLRIEDIPASRVFGEVRDALASARASRPDSPEWVSATNRVCGFYEHHTAKTIFATGATWPGIHVWDDMRTVDYLATRPDVDPERIGVIGLSGGGFRTALLIAADPRIKAASITGWMTEFARQLKHHVRHTWMVWMPGMYRYLDLPDAVTLHAPGALLVQQCRRDVLYPLSAMESVLDKLTRLYAKAGVPEKFRGTFYDVPHSFRPEMQDEAFDWMARHL